MTSTKDDFQTPAEIACPPLLPYVGYPVILADPPWLYKVWSKKGHGRSAEHHYSTQDTEWLKTLPVEAVAAKDCALLMWITGPMMPQSLEVMAAWGFKYQTFGLSWLKRCKYSCKPRMGMGHYTRANAEICILGTRGHPKRLDKGVEQLMVTEEEYYQDISEVIWSPISTHSAKPDEQYSKIERLFGGPYLEMFHRPRDGMFPPRAGWTFLGNEVTGRSMEEDLRLLAESFKAG